MAPTVTRTLALPERLALSGDRDRVERDARTWLARACVEARYFPMEYDRLMDSVELLDVPGHASDLVLAWVEDGARRSLRITVS